MNNYLTSSDKLFGLLLSEPFKIDQQDYNEILEEKRLWKRMNQVILSLLCVI